MINKSDNKNDIHIDLDQYMKVRFMTEEAEKEILNSNIENFADDIIEEHHNDQNTDFEVLDFIDNKKLIKSSLVDRELSKIDSEASISEINNIVNSWINEFENEKVHDNEVFNFINSALYEFKKEEKLNESKKSVPKLRKYKTILYTTLSAAASILLFIAVYLFSGDQANSSEIFTEYYDTYEYIGTEIRSSGTDQTKLLQEASALYSESKFYEATVKYKEFIAIDKTYVQAYFYLGMSQMETEQFNEAIITFDEIIIKFDEFEIESKWYSSLCYLMLEDKKNAYNYLKEISDINCIWQKDAQNLIKKISKD